MAKPTADVCDEWEQDDSMLLHSFKAFGKRKTFAGRVVIVKSFEDNVLAADLIQKEDGAGKILFIDGGASMNCALFGDVMAGKAIKNKWEGVVVNGMIRDSEQIREMNIGVMALGTNPKRSNKKGTGEKTNTCEIQGKKIFVNDFAYCDEGKKSKNKAKTLIEPKDGIVIVKPKL